VTARSTQETARATYPTTTTRTTKAAEMATAAAGTTIKISYEGEIRRIPIDNKLTFAQFVEQTKSYFSSLNGKEVKFSYLDDENDRVMVSSDLEFQEGLKIMLSDPQRYPRFEVTLDFTSSSSLCSECHSPLPSDGNGVIFKCSARSNYEICQQCEANLTSPPPHPLVKYYPSSTTHPRIVVTMQTNGASSSPRPSSPVSHDQRKSCLHHGIRCDECGISPIVGPRYKCSGRPDYDLCANCEHQKIQPFPMVKISSPEHSASGIHIFNSHVGTSASSSSSATDDPNIHGGLEMLHEFLPHLLHHRQFPPDHSNRNWRERTKEMFQRYCRHSQESGSGDGSRENSSHRTKWSSFGHCHANPSSGEKEDQQIDQEILNIVMKESLETGTSSPPSAPPSAPEMQASSSNLTHEEDAVIWSKELGLLRAMGFMNQEALVPLLKEHLGTPIDQGFPNPESMQTLIFSLLSNI
jgi:hypothetical protein